MSKRFAVKTFLALAMAVGMRSGDGGDLSFSDPNSIAPPPAEAPATEPVVLPQGPAQIELARRADVPVRDLE